MVGSELRVAGCDRYLVGFSSLLGLWVISNPGKMEITRQKVADLGHRAHGAGHKAESMGSQAKGMGLIFSEFHISQTEFRFLFSDFLNPISVI
jgi:hypothetical protein